MPNGFVADGTLEIVFNKYCPNGASWVKQAQLRIVNDPYALKNNNTNDFIIINTIRLNCPEVLYLKYKNYIGH